MELKTEGQLFQEIIENDLEFYSINDFLLFATEYKRKKAAKLLTKKIYNQLDEYLKSFDFVNLDEIQGAIADYFDITKTYSYGFGDIADFYELAEQRTKENNLKLDDDKNIIK